MIAPSSKARMRFQDGEMIPRERHFRDPQLEYKGESMRQARLLLAAAALMMGLGMTACSSVTGPCDASDATCHTGASGNHTGASGNHTGASGN